MSLEADPTWRERSTRLTRLDSSASARTICGCSTGAKPAPRSNASDVVGGVFSPHCAALQPLSLVRALASEVAGFASIWEHTAALAIEPGVVRTTFGPVRAEVVIRATKGFTPSLKGQTRAVAPVYSLMIATEPMPAGDLARAGSGRPGDLLRSAPPDHLRAAHGRRSDRLRRPRCAVPSGLAGSTGVRPQRAMCLRCCERRCWSCFRRCRESGSATAGVARSASPGTGTRRWAWIAPRDSAGPAGTSATACRRRTWPAGP